MKKILFMGLIMSAVVPTALQAQSSQQAALPPQAKEGVKAPATTAAPAAAQGLDDAAMLQQAKEKQAPPMVEKTGLTLAQAERVIEINFEIRQAARGLRDLSEADRSVKIAEFKALKEKKYSEVLTPEQVKAVYAYYEDMGKNMQRKSN